MLVLQLLLTRLPTLKETPQEKEEVKKADERSTLLLSSSSCLSCYGRESLQSARCFCSSWRRRRPAGGVAGLLEESQASWRS
ncbi:unnamed protein product [Lota lota]